ncbi:hypothetical protein MTO96_011020 [Rhipicephalus appendiculatus]
MMAVPDSGGGGGVGARSITVNETLFACTSMPLRWVVGPPKAQLFDARAALIRRGLIGFVNDHLVRTGTRARPHSACALFERRESTRPPVS